MRGRWRWRYAACLFGACIGATFSFFDRQSPSPTIVAVAWSESLIRAPFGFVSGAIICGLVWWIFGPLTLRLRPTEALSAYSLGNPGGELMSSFCFFVGVAAGRLAELAAAHTPLSLPIEIGRLSFVIGIGIAIAIASELADRAIVVRQQRSDVHQEG